MRTVSVEGDPTRPPPRWAVLQRHVFDRMGAAAKLFVETYTRPDGTLVWHEKDTPWRDAHGRTRKDANGQDMEWPGMDGSDDGYEAFFSIPLLYCLGGDDELHSIARKQWEAVTWQFTQYGQIEDEWDAHYDWMHHGESSQFIYYLGLCDPNHFADRARSLKFAGHYIGEGADNWDAELKMIKSPFNGSKGAHYVCTEFDWCTHRDQLARSYLCPFLDHPDVPAGAPWDFKVDWNDDSAMEAILAQMNARQTRGDIPMNLLATSLVTHAYLFSPSDKEKYKTWVMEYLAAWKSRARTNDGLLPDNIGPSGKIGELMDGKWWGGYYGYRWPHGVTNSQEAILVAGANAFLLTSDPSSFDLFRSQSDFLHTQGKLVDGVYMIPARHSDEGWCDYRRPESVAHGERNLILLYYWTQLEEDRQRLHNAFPVARPGGGGWPVEIGNFSKGGQFSPGPWHTWTVEGGNVEYPIQVLEATLSEIGRRMEMIEADDWSDAAIQDWDVHHWQNLNPAVPQGLMQLTCGTPGIVYHGGLMHTRMFYFDPVRRRPGLPHNVAALVSSVKADKVTLTLVNTDVLESRPVIIQAGAFAEHRFTTATLSYWASGGAQRTVEVKVDDLHLRLELAACAQVELTIGMTLNVRGVEPSYRRPWDDVAARASPRSQTIRGDPAAPKL
jgi:hypothetical protein